MIDAPRFYDRLAADYERQFDAPHRRAYDDLAWDRVAARLPDHPGLVVDVGCGVGRWAERFVAAGHRVLAFDPSSEMVAAAEGRDLGERFTAEVAGVDEVDVPEQTADIVVAMGSIQYAPEPAASINRMGRWLRPGGTLAVLCDSLLALAVELVAEGRIDEAVQRAITTEAQYRLDGWSVEHRLFDATTLRAAFEDAGLAAVEVQGLLVSWSARGRADTIDRLRRDYRGALDEEDRLARCTRLADAGKQLLALGVRPNSPDLPRA